MAQMLYEQAAQQGYVNAFNLGVMYNNGDGGERDMKKAKEYYEQAAHLGDAMAMNTLGWMCHNGLGDIEQSYDKAKKYYERAIEANDTPSPLHISNLAFLIDQNNGTEASHTKVRKWYEQAIADKDDNGQYQMGVSYEQGNGVTKSLSKAKEWYAKAAVQKEPRAIKAMERLNIHHVPTPFMEDGATSKKSCSNCGRPETSDHLLKECQRCRSSSIYYCNSSCKKGHWKAHKKECKRFAKKLHVQ
jgi:TPR repeat protein